MYTLILTLLCVDVRDGVYYSGTWMIGMYNKHYSFCPVSLTRTKCIIRNFFYDHTSINTLVECSMLPKPTRESFSLYRTNQLGLHGIYSICTVEIVICVHQKSNKI